METHNAIRMRGRSLREPRLAAPALLSAAVTLGVLAGCAPRPLLERAVRARGGPLAALVIDAEARVHGHSETWRYTRAFRSPDQYGWKIVTAAEPISHLFDGNVARSFVGSAQVSYDPSPNAPLRTHARWTAVVNLDGLSNPSVTLTPLAVADLPAGVREGLRATFADGVTYRLGFDERTLLVWASGPLDLSPLAKGEATAHFTDHRRAAHLVLPFATSYWFGTNPIADERVLAYCVDPLALTDVSFDDPDKLPDCP